MHNASYSRGWLAPVALSVALGLAPARADSVRLIDTDTDAAQIRVDLVRQAREQIDIAYFIYDDDEAGRVGFHLLREAARAGRTVRLLVDWQWNAVAQPMMRYLMDEGIQIRLYHPFHLFKPLWWSRRMHDKFIVVDGEHLLLGGRNIENSYYGFGDHKYIDRDIYVRGETAGAARDYFESLWNSEHVVEPEFRELGAQALDDVRTQVDEGLEILSKLRIVEPDRPRDWSGETIPAESLRFLHDTLLGKRKRPGIAADLDRVLGATRERLILESPYLVLTRGTRRLLRDLTRRGVQVRIATNSLKTTDNVFAQAGYVGHRKELVRMGIELWEYAGRRSLHSKSAVADGRTVMVGTYNLDPRSERLNSEVAVIVDDRALAEALAKSMDRNLEESWRIGRNGKPEGHDQHYPEVGRGKKWKLRLLRLILPLIRRQL